MLRRALGSVLQNWAPFQLDIVVVEVFACGQAGGLVSAARQLGAVGQLGGCHPADGRGRATTRTREATNFSSSRNACIH